jgi:hypothetical protein
MVAMCTVDLKFEAFLRQTDEINTDSDLKSKPCFRQNVVAILVFSKKGRRRLRSAFA